MSSFFTRKLNIIAIFLFLFFVFGSYLIYKDEKEQIKKHIYSELTNNSLTIKSYFMTAQSLIYSLEYTLKDKLNFDNIKHPAFENYKYDKKKNLYKIVNYDGLKSIDLSSLNGIGDPTKFSEEKKKEINVALYLKPIFTAAMEAIPDLKWIYYTSSNDFVYISPDHNYKDVKTFKSYYKAAFWQEAIPKNNPSNNLVITDLYDDFAGKGLMTTLSKPIYINDIFRGIVSIDIGINTLNNLLPKTNLKGKTFLVDEKYQIVAANYKFKLEDKINCEDKNTIKIEVLENELYLAHKIKAEVLNKEALFNAQGKILILFLLLLITMIAIYLKKLLTKVQYYANTDPLTNLLNRRSMKKAIEKLIDISKRYEQDLSFLSIDIDHFKIVNDNYGHQMGDKVLVEISKLFINNTRTCDVVARLGGEEFLIALVNTDLDEAYILAERIRIATQKIEIDTNDLRFTISIGCTKLRHNDTYYSILKRVDKLLYRAKDKGRNQTVKEGEN